MKNFSKEFLATIGAIAINSTLLEYTLIRAISNLLSSAQKSLLMRLLLSSDSLTGLLLKYKNVIIYFLLSKNLYKDELKKETDELFSGLKQLIDLRNIVIHSFWAIDEKGRIVRAKYKRHLKNDMKILEDKQLTLSAIYDLPDEIMQIIKRLNAFNKKIFTLVSD